jgi:hypothetical protein
MFPVLSLRLLAVACAAVTLPLAVTTDVAAAEPREEAKALATRGAMAFKLAHFQEALDLYTQAYERFPAPALLFNLGQCNKNLGHYDRALFFFQGYLRDKPDAPNRAAVVTLIAEATKQLADERAAHASEEAEHRKLEEAEAAKLAAEPTSGGERRLRGSPRATPTTRAHRRGGHRRRGRPGPARYGDLLWLARVVSCEPALPALDVRGHLELARSIHVHERRLVGARRDRAPRGGRHPHGSGRDGGLGGLEQARRQSCGHGQRLSRSG